MEPLSRLLENGSSPRLPITSKKDDAMLNHLLFIDDIKLFAKDKEELNSLLDLTVNTLDKIGLKINKEKSATNYPTNAIHAQEIGRDVKLTQSLYSDE